MSKNAPAASGTRCEDRKRLLRSPPLHRIDSNKKGYRQHCVYSLWLPLRTSHYDVICTCLHAWLIIRPNPIRFNNWLRRIYWFEFLFFIGIVRCSLKLTSSSCHEVAHIWLFFPALSWRGLPSACKGVPSWSLKAYVRSATCVSGMDARRTDHMPGECGRRWCIKGGVKGVPFGRAIEGVYGVPIFAVHATKHRFLSYKKSSYAFVVHIRRTHSSYAFVVRIRRTHSAYAFVVRFRRLHNFPILLTLYVLAYC